MHKFSRITFKLLVLNHVSHKSRVGKRFVVVIAGIGKSIHAHILCVPADDYMIGPKSVVDQISCHFFRHAYEDDQANLSYV